MTETQHVKLVFECNIGEIDKDGQDEYRIETMWAIPIGKNFKLDNVPFYAMGVSRGDIVSAEKEDGRFHFKKVLKRAGNITVRIYLSEKKAVRETCKELQAMGCSVEISDIPELIAVDMSPKIFYKDVLGYIDDGVAKEKWIYEEACLGFEEDKEE